MDIAYGEEVGGKTPDWIDRKRSVIVEVFTTERDASLPPLQRMAEKLTKKVDTYAEIVRSQALSLIVAIHPDFVSGLDLEDAPDCLRVGNHFERHPDLSGVLFFAEANAGRNGLMRMRGQPYEFQFFSNPRAKRPYALSE